MIDYLLGGLKNIFVFVGLLLAAGLLAAFFAGEKRKGCLRLFWIAAIAAVLYWLYRTGRFPFS